MIYPSVLVFGNNCFSKIDSNGRTLGNFFLGWPKDKLAQFYIQNAEPDFSYCTHYFRVTDKQALKSIYSKCEGGVISKPSDDISSVRGAVRSLKNNRNPITMLIREMVWMFDRWQTQEYKNWVHKINPDIVLIQAGDCSFMFKLAMQTAKQFGAKFVIYNTEGYYFKHFDYFRSRGLAHILYPIFHHNLMRFTRKAYNMADFSIFNCEALRDDFCKEFHLKSDVIYTATDSIDTVTSKPVHSGFITSYAGNLGVGRPQSLIDVANVLHSIDESYYLDLYGTIPNDEIKEMFDNCPGIRFHGRISYGEVKEVIQSCDLLLHVEGFESYYREDLKYAFSTKIADYLASNTCFLIYAPSELAETQYLIRNNAAYVVDCIDDLKPLLKVLTSNPDIRKKYCNNALELAKRNHDRNNSISRFQKILCDLYAGN